MGNKNQRNYIWDTTADDGKEFINIGKLDEISEADVKKITGLKKLTDRQLGLERDKFKASISGMLLDRTTYAVIEPDARVRGQLTQGFLAGTGRVLALTRWPSESILFAKLSKISDNSFLLLGLAQ